MPALARRGAHVRGFIRDPKQSDAVRKNGAAEIAVGDLSDRKSLKAALAGVDGVFYIAPAFLPNVEQSGQSVVEAAQLAGVQRFVFSSVIHPTLSALINHRVAAPVEEAILDTGLEYTILHPALFFQNLSRSWADVTKTGVYSEPWSAESRFSRVDYRDVAEVTAIALMENRLAYGTYELCAEGYLNRHDLAALMGEVMGACGRSRNYRPDGAVRHTPANAGDVRLVRSTWFTW